MEETYPGRQRVNIGKPGRVLSVMAGSLLTYHAIRKHRADTLLLLGGAYLFYRGLSGHCTLSSWLSRPATAGGSRNINIRAGVLVNRSREEVFSHWRRLETLPLFMKHLESVREVNEKLSHWTLKTPGGLGNISWDAEIVKEEPGSLLAWQSLPGSPVENAGKIHFSDTAGKGTRITAFITYRAPYGAAGEAISRVLNPVFSDLIEKDILNFKHYAENIGVAGQ